MNNSKLTLASLCDGSLQERVDRALLRLAENILDERCDPEAKRKLKITVTFKAADGNPDDVKVEADVSLALAPEIGVATKMSIGREKTTGLVTMQEYRVGEIVGQLSMDDVEL